MKENPDTPKKKPALLMMGSKSEVDRCPMQWWSERGTLSGTILAGHNVQKRRSSLFLDNVNKLVYLSDWWKLEQLRLKLGPLSLAAKSILESDLRHIQVGI